MRQLELYFMMFAAISVAGWLMEVACKYIEYKRFINRGFLIGPYCPVYGVGAVLVTLMLEDCADSPLVVFFLAMLVCGALEYLTGWAMEKIFHARWWDYSQRRFNLNGRVCLDTLLPFGILSMVIVYLIKPALFGLFGKMSVPALHITSAAVLAIMLADIVISIRTLLQIRSSAELTGADDTEALTAAVREELIKKGALLRRYIRAFPYMRLYNTGIIKEIKKKQTQIKAEARELHRQIAEKYKEK